jgi:tetratricopeptide (TPR) repeat protein
LEEASEAFLGLAKIYGARKQYDHAFALAKLALGLKPNAPEYVQTYAEILIERCETSQALETLRTLGEKGGPRTSELIKRAKKQADDC